MTTTPARHPGWQRSFKSLECDFKIPKRRQRKHSYHSVYKLIRCFNYSGDWFKSYGRVWNFNLILLWHFHKNKRTNKHKENKENTSSDIGNETRLTTVPRLFHQAAKVNLHEAVPHVWSTLGPVLWDGVLPLFLNHWYCPLLTSFQPHKPGSKLHDPTMKQGNLKNKQKVTYDMK